MINKIMKITGILLGMIGTLILILVVIAIVSDNGKIMLPVNHKIAFSQDEAIFTDLLSVQGNEVINQSGETVILKGVMAHDPDRLNKEKAIKC